MRIGGVLEVEEWTLIWMGDGSDEFSEQGQMGRGRGWIWIIGEWGMWNLHHGIESSLICGETNYFPFPSFGFKMHALPHGV